MEQLVGNIISELPIKGLQKFGDLIAYEGPVLSHFRDNNGTNYLYYWVDYDEHFNRWLIWKITEEQLYDYLKRRTTLKELLLSKNKDFIFSVDIDSNLHYHNISIFPIALVNEEYIPEEESYFKFEPPSFYSPLIDAFEQDFYLQILKERAIYFKLEPSSPKFSTTISASDAANFLKKISFSFSNFIEYDFFENYKSKISDLSRLNRIVRQFKELLEPRVVSLSYGSFNVGLSSDTLHTVDDSNSYKEWQLSIFEKYRNDVIEVDYNSEQDATIIAQKYPEEIRRKVFAPIIEAINNPAYTVEVTTWKNDFKKQFNIIQKKSKKIIIPDDETISDQPEEKVLVNATFEITKGGDIKNLGKKDLQSNLLFAEIVEQVAQKLNSITIEDKTFEFKQPLEVLVDLKEGKYHIYNKDLNMKVEASNKEDAYNLFYKSFLQVYKQSATIQNSPLREIFLQILK